MRAREALAVASRHNATRWFRPQFAHANWLDGINGPFDLIVSNPPYIAEHDAHLPALRHAEPPLQAPGERPGWAADLRYPGDKPPRACTGRLAFRHGDGQAEAVELLRPAGLKDTQSRRDLAGIERCSALLPRGAGIMRTCHLRRSPRPGAPT